MHNKTRSLLNLLNPVKLGCLLEGKNYESLNTADRNRLSSKYGQLIKRCSPNFIARVAKYLPQLCLSDEALEKMDSVVYLDDGVNEFAVNDFYEAIETFPECEFGFGKLSDSQLKA